MSSSPSSDDLLLPQDTREVQEVWDNFNIDLLIRVASLSIISPVFAGFVPVTLLSQGYHPHSSPVYWSYFYLFLCLLRWLWNYTENVWINWDGWREAGDAKARGLGPVGCTIRALLATRQIKWDEQIVVITGGASGIGQILTETLGVRNVTVVVLDTKDYVSEWDDVYYFKCDVSNKAQVDEVAKTIREEIGDPTVLINNAGIVNGKLLLDLSEEEVKKSFDVNVLSQFWTIKAFLPAMLEKRKGHIVTVSSIMGRLGVAQLSDYCASKAALIAMHESLRYELKTRYDAPPIRLTLLTPGHVRTSLFPANQLHASLSSFQSRLNSFFAPIVDPHSLAKEIIKALDSYQSGEICLPWYSEFGKLVYAAPSWTRDFLHWVVGSNVQMRRYGVKANNGSREKAD